MTKDEALKLALEALEKSHTCPLLPDDCAEAITAIKEALEQPEHGWTPERIAGIARLKDAQDKRLAQPSVSVEQEPVTWRYKIVDVFGRPIWTLKTPRSDTRVLESQPLYTTPPQRKPLTDEMREQMRFLGFDTLESRTPFVAGWLKAEAAHGIKGEA